MRGLVLAVSGRLTQRTLPTGCARPSGICGLVRATWQACRDFNEKDSAALVGFKRLRDESFNKVFVECNSVSVVVNFETPMRTNCIVLKEALNRGQKVSRFRVRLVESNNDSEDLKGTTIGSKKIITFSTRVLKHLYLFIDNYKGGLVPEVSVSECLIPENLIEK